MSKTAFGFVFHVTKYADGDIDIGFYDKDNDSADTYSTKDGKLPKELA